MLVAKPFQRSPWSVQILLAAADTTKVIKAAPGAGLKLVVTRWYYQSTTSAAQTMSYGDGTIIIDVIAASITAGTRVEGPIGLEVGVSLTANAAFSLTPAAAGPAGRIFAEGYIDNA